MEVGVDGLLPLRGGAAVQQLVEQEPKADSRQERVQIHLLKTAEMLVQDQVHKNNIVHVK